MIQTYWRFFTEQEEPVQIKFSGEFGKPSRQVVAQLVSSLPVGQFTKRFPFGIIIGQLRFIHASIIAGESLG